MALLLVLAGLLGYARYRANRFLADIPRRLGIDVKSETNGFTLSQSSKGRTLFTVHAARAVQHENGKTTLHDVAITLYGPQGSNRTDSIRGDTFEYDQPNGVVRAAGDVHLDLAAPSPAATAGPAAKRMQVTTRGLVFLQKLGVAATDEPLEVVYGDLHGGAIGADYESDTGMLRLRRDVHLDGVQSGDRMHLDAASAELDRNARIATLHAAHVAAKGLKSSGDRMTLLLGKAGGIEQVDADGKVLLDQGDGTRAEAPRLHARMNDAGKLQEAAMSGGVRLLNGSDAASSQEAAVRFNAEGQAQSLDLRQAVRVETANGRTGDRSVLTASALQAQLVQNGKRTELRDVVATGGAELRSDVRSAVPTGERVAAGTSATRKLVLTAKTLHGITALDGRERFLSAVDGTGDTRLDERDSAGNTRTSSGDALHLDLLPRSRIPPGAASGALQQAVQTGHVVVAQHTVPRPPTANGQKTEAQDSRATAERAVFDSTSQRLVLTGNPILTAAGLQLAADRVELPQAEGTAIAEGSVKGTLVQGAAQETVHVTAARAAMATGSGTARFFGGQDGTKLVRMWTSTAQLQAPVVDLDRGKGSLLAHSAEPGRGTVRLLLPGSALAGRSAKEAAAGSLLVTGDAAKLSAATGQSPATVDVTGYVRIAGSGSELRARQAVATLKQAAQPAGARLKAANPLSGGSVESILATGDVHVQQPGRSGSGERLLYTAADSSYRLTGTAAAPPVLVDSLRGTVTGSTLIFHGGDDSVEVAGEDGRRVRTETHASPTPRSR